MDFEFSNTFHCSRENKGKSLFETPSDYTLIDIETTGLSSTFDEIIEITAIKVKNHTRTDVFNTLINPDVEIPEYITELTGISNADVNNAPCLNDIIEDYLTFLGTDVLIGHNVNFDINFLYDKILENTGKFLSNNFVDTMRLSRRLFPDFKTHKLNFLCENFNLTPPKHRALEDCVSTYELYNYILQHMESNYITLEDIKPKKTAHRHISASDIVQNVGLENPEHMFYGKNCVFTGRLDKMERKNAMQMVIDIGGHCQDNVSKKTNYLILGMSDYRNSLKDSKSNKQKKAEEYIKAGLDIEVIDEQTFYDLFNEF